MNSYDTHTTAAPQGRGTAVMILMGGIALIGVAVYLALQTGGVLQNMAPLVWWSILGFLGFLGIVMLWGGGFLLRSLNALNRQAREHAQSFAESAQVNFRGSGLSLQSFDDSTQDDGPRIGVASLHPRPFEGADPDTDIPLQFTDSQLSADRGFRTSEPTPLSPPPVEAPAPAPAPASAPLSDLPPAVGAATGELDLRDPFRAPASPPSWEPTQAQEAPPAPAPVTAAYRPSGNFSSPEPTTASQFGSLPTAPAAFVARPTPAPFANDAAAEADPAAEFWMPALQQLDLPRYSALIDRVFTQAGFVTQPQALSSPGMSAIWLFSRSHLGAPVSLVLCEHGSGEGLRPHRLEELRDVMATHRIRRGQFATTSPVGTAMQALAAQYAINLLDIPHLLNTISKRKPAQQAELWELVRSA